MIENIKTSQQIYKNYTSEEFIEVDRLIKYFLRKYLSLNSFKILRPYYDELYSNCHFKAFKYSSIYNPSYAKTTFINLLVKTELIGYFKTLNTTKGKSLILNTIKIDEKSKLDNTKDLLSSKLFGTYEDYEKNLNFDFILNIYKEATKNEKDKIKNIMYLIISGESQTSIARELNLSRQYVSQIHDKLKFLMYVELKKSGYSTKYLNNYNPNLNKIPIKYKRQLLQLQGL